MNAQLTNDDLPIFPFGVGKLAKKPDQLKKDDQPPLGAVMAKLAKNTVQRNNAESALNYAEIKIRASKEGHIATLGRLVKYEGLPIIEEALDYAKSAGMFVKCDSKCIGVKTYLFPYTNKNGKSAPAHFSIYDTFLEMAKEGDQEPKYYKGNFLYKTYAEQFEKYRNNSVQSFVKINDLFDFTEKSV
jgi:hypothetical protein